MENGYSTATSNKNGLEFSSSTATSIYQIPKQFMLSRGFSKVQANEEILNETRSKIKNKLCREDNENGDNSLHLLSELPDYSFMLPDLNKFEDYKFKEYLTNDLIELPTQYALTESGHLNWWSQGNWENVCRPLYPMVTSGDGNCLLHAASLAMWGLHDRSLVLRKALHSSLENIKENASPLWRRWKWEQMCQNKKYGLIYNDEEWSKEWKSLLKLSSYQPRVSNVTSTTNSSSSTSSNNINGMENNSDNQSNGQDGQVYFESLEEFHVFLLAHILQRPIIIVADTMLHDSDGEPLSPIPFGGIYLPFECELKNCHRYPLVLAYDSAHFSALVLMDDLDLDEDNTNNNETNSQLEAQNNINSSSLNSTTDNNNYVDIEKINKKFQTKYPFSIIPITYSNNRELLPIHFAYDPGSDYDWSQFPNSDNHNVNSNTNNQIQNSNIELSRDQKLFLLQKYLDIVKLQLYEPGPTVKRNVNIPTNSSGLRVNVTNVRVNEINQDSSSLSSSNNSNNYVDNEKIKTLKQTANNKLQKFLSIFKKSSSSNNQPILIKTKALKDIHVKSYDEIMNKSLNSTTSSTNNTNNQQQNTLFHKLVMYKNWQSLFDSMNHHICLLGVKLNLAKPPKFSRIIKNYLDLAQHKFDLMKQQQQQQTVKQQQQQHVVTTLNNNNNNSNVKTILVSNKSISNGNSLNGSENNNNLKVEDVSDEPNVINSHSNSSIKQISSSNFS